MEKNINIINKTLYKYIEKLSKNRALRSSIIKTKISNIEIAPTYIKSINKDINWAPKYNKSTDKLTMDIIKKIMEFIGFLLVTDNKVQVKIPINRAKVGKTSK